MNTMFIYKSCVGRKVQMVGPFHLLPRLLNYPSYTLSPLCHSHHSSKHTTLILQTGFPVSCY